MFGRLKSCFRFTSWPGVPRRFKMYVTHYSWAELNETLHLTDEKLRSETVMKWTVDGLTINRVPVWRLYLRQQVFLVHSSCMRALRWRRDWNSRYIPLRFFNQINIYYQPTWDKGQIISLVLTVISYRSCWALGRGVTAQIVQLLQHTKVHFKCIVNTYCIGRYAKYTSIE